MMYLQELMHHVKLKIKTALPDQIAIVFDSRFSGSTHFVGIVWTYLSDNTANYDQVLLVSPSLENEASQNV